jgi:hypothetical protein
VGCDVRLPVRNGCGAAHDGLEAFGCGGVIQAVCFFIR